MKQKIHIPCHSEQSEESHFQIPKLPHWLIFFLLCSFFSSAQQTQPYEWQWAMNGGASLGGTGGGFSDEQIFDIKVGTDSNYYFIATLAGPYNANLNGEEVPSYNNSNTALGNFATDIFLFSTDCEGQVRWSQTIGGWRDDAAYNLVLDDQNNVYIGANVGVNTAGSGPGIRRPLHFTENDSIPFANTANGGGQIPQEAFKTTYLVKYSSGGQLIDKVTLQGDVTNVPSEFQSLISDLAIDSQGKIHFIIGLLQGTHLDGQVTVPSSFNDQNNPQYYLAVYNSDLTYHSSILLDMSGNFFYPSVRFTYDENKNQYYIAGMTSLGISGTTYPFSFDGNPIVNRSFILAFDDNDGSEKWRREIYSDPGTSSNLAGNIITSLVVDDESNIYIGGCRFRHPTYPELKIYDPTDSSVSPYFITTGADFTVPMIVKFDSIGNVIWDQAMTNIVHPAPSLMRGKGIAIKDNEVAFGAQIIAGAWGTIAINLPINNYQPDPALIRFDKQSGTVLEVHGIEGDPMSNKRMTAVAADHDGNFIAGGSFEANLFMNNTLGINPLFTTGESDFFIAKLANSECGSGLSTDDFNALSFNVYPNPTTGIINVETREQLSAYTIYDATGRLIRQSMFDASNQVNLENASNGVYFIRIVTVEGNAGTVKVVKR